MSTTETNAIQTQLLAELQEAAVKAAKGIRNSDEARQAAREVDWIREENRRRFGDQAIGFSIIREFRGQRPE